MATTKLQTFENNPLTFGVVLTESDDRLDCAWFNPVIENKIDVLRKSKRKDRNLFCQRQFLKHFMSWYILPEYNM